MIKPLQYHIVTFTIFLTMVIAFARPINAQSHAVEPFDFRANKANKRGEVNVDPFKYRGNPIKFNSFLIWPNLTLEQEYNDNVLATKFSKQNDFATSIKPSLIIKKDIKRHEFIISLDAEMRRYWDLNNENVENYNALFKSNIEANHTTNIPLKLSYRDGHIKRNSQRRLSTNDLSITPLRVRSYEFEGGISHKPNRLEFELLGNIRKAKLYNNKLFSGQNLIRNNRNITALKATGRISYEMPNIWKPYTELTWGDDNFTNEAPTTITRNNNILRILLGTMFNYKGLIYGYLGSGWEQRSYDSNTIQKSKGLSIDTKITWEPQAKTMFIFDLSRKTFEDNEIIAGITETATGIELRHELQRDLFIKLMGEYETEEFSSSLRKDNTITTGIGLNYISGPRLQIGMDYNYTQRDSTISGLDLSNNIFMIRAKTSW